MKKVYLVHRRQTSLRSDWNYNDQITGAWLDKNRAHEEADRYLDVASGLDVNPKPYNVHGWVEKVDLNE